MVCDTYTGSTEYRDIGFNGATSIDRGTRVDADEGEGADKGVVHDFEGEG